MRNQFFYTYKNEKNEDCSGSFNIEYVIRTLETTSGGISVLLDDFHIEKFTTPVQSGKKVEMQMRNETVCSNIILTKEDSERFRKLFEII